MIVQRKDLVEGVKYFMDARRTDKGVFKGREVDSIYFDCGCNTSYYETPAKGWEGLVAFMSEGDGFEQVLIQDDLT